MTHRGYLTLCALDQLGVSTLKMVASYGYGRSPSKARVSLEALRRAGLVDTVGMPGEAPRYRITAEGRHAVAEHRPSR